MLRIITDHSLTLSGALLAAMFLYASITDKSDDKTLPSLQAIYRYDMNQSGPCGARLPERNR